MRALVVDDSRAMRTMMRRLMEGFGFEVLDAADGQEALDVLEREGTVDVALVDWHMPNLDGIGFIMSLQDDAELFKIRTVMVSAETDFKKVVYALKNGADEYLMKPVTKEGLAEKLSILGLISEVPA